jgi:hypothetical protein
VASHLHYPEKRSRLVYSFRNAPESCRRPTCANTAAYASYGQLDDKTNFLSAAERNSDADRLGTLALTCRAIGIGFCKQAGFDRID